MVTWHDGPVRTPPITPLLSRRSAIRLAGTVALGTAGVVLLAGCTDSGEPPEPEIDPLVAQADLARRDAATAAAVAAVAPERAEALAVVGSERTAHAKALDAEIARVAGIDPSASSTPSAGRGPNGPSTATPSGAAAPPPTLDQLRGELARSQRSAADLARIQSGFRAGLLGSISAACATHTAVLLR